VATMPVGENTRVRMTGRDSAEPNRVASRLELLCDLTFVVAVGQLAYALAHDGDHVREPAMIVPYLMVFFAIWWAWINLAWFASAYDTDDALYRILTAVQMSGVLVLAAGVPGAFGEFDGTGLTVGYLLMRLGQVAQWVRVAVENPEGRSTAVRYGIGIGSAQAGWILLLVLHTSHRWLVAGFLVLVAVELAVPPWAERQGKLSWHPRHIAERYGLFYILLLGESVLAVAIGVREGLDGAAVTPALVVVGLAGLVLVVSLWWLYFLEPAERGLTKHREGAFFWGYGHYLLFAALAAEGAWLEVAVEAVSHHLDTGDLRIAYGLAAPVAVVLLTILLVHVPFDRLGLGTIPRWVLLTAAALVLLAPLPVAAIGLPAVVSGIALIVAGAVAVASNQAAARSSTGRGRRWTRAMVRGT